MVASGFSSTWLPLQQEHGVGREAHFDPLRGDVERGPMWTDDGATLGDLAMSPWQTLPAGEYTAILQLFHPLTAGAPVGTLAAERDDGSILAETPVVTAAHDFGDWQRACVAFRLDAPARARVRFRHEHRVSIWTGAMHLTRGGRRPIYVIGHNRNTPEQVNRSLALGANAIEVDLSVRNGELLAAETPPWPNWTEVSKPREWLANLQAQRDKWAFLYVDCKTATAKDGDVYRFGRDVIAALAEAGVEPARCMISVPDPSGVAVHRAAIDAGYGAAALGMDSLHDMKPGGVAKELWAQMAEEYRLPFLGLGRPSWDITTPLSRWFPILQATVAARDRGAAFPKKIVHWSLDDKDGMRKVLDLGVDGAIVEHEDRLCQVLEEEPYRSFCRRAEPSDWAPLRAHGVDP